MSAADSKKKTLLERIPALRRVVTRPKRGHIPVVQQLTATDCGAACLAMALGVHGRHVRLDELRDTLAIGRDGTSLPVLLSGARAYGLRARAIKIDLKDLPHLPPGTILHWEFQHYVVFDRLRKSSVEIVDPAFGRRTVSLDELRRAMTGIAMVSEPAEGFTRGSSRKGTLRRYVRFFLGMRREVARILVVSVLLQLFAMVSPAVTGMLVDRVLPRGDRELLMVLGIGLVTLVCFQLIASLVRAHLLVHLRTAVDARMTATFLEHLVSLPYSFFQRRSTGDLVMRLSSNAAIRELLTSSVLSGALDGSLVIIYLVVIFAAAPSLGLLVTALALVEVGIYALAGRKQRELKSQELASEARVQGYQVELLSGIETVKGMGGEERAVEHWSNQFVNLLNVTLERGRLGASFEALLGAARLGAPLAVLGAGTVLVLDEKLSLGTMLALVALTGNVLTPIAQLVANAMQLQMLGSYTDRLADVFDAAPEQGHGDEPRDRVALRGRIALDRVSFRYTPRSPAVVDDVSVEVQAGQCVAIVGRSGAGKTTLANLLLGLYTPSSGRIAYDGIDLGRLDLGHVRRQLGIVGQRHALFGTTIRQNIAAADPTMPLERVMDAAKLAQIHDEIMAMPMGYDTLLSDGGASLSGGQRQRIALARALVNRPAILLLDEATSALDGVTEAAIQRELEGLRCTRIVIAHRLSTVMRADWILVMDAGRLVEAGTHEELVELGGVYAEQVRTQMGGEAEEGARRVG